MLVVGSLDIVVCDWGMSCFAAVLWCDCRLLRLSCLGSGKVVDNR